MFFGREVKGSGKLTEKKKYRNYTITSFIVKAEDETNISTIINIIPMSYITQHKRIRYIIITMYNQI